MTRRGPNQDSLSRSVRELDASLGQVKSITPAVYARVAALWREVLPARSPALPPSLCPPPPPPSLSLARFFARSPLFCLSDSSRPNHVPARVPCG